MVFGKDTDNEVTLYYQSELDIVNVLLENDQLWADVVQEELDLSINDYLTETVLKPS